MPRLTSDLIPAQSLASHPQALATTAPAQSSKGPLIVDGSGTSTGYADTQARRGSAEYLKRQVASRSTPVIFFDAPVLDSQYDWTTRNLDDELRAAKIVYEKLMEATGQKLKPEEKQEMAEKLDSSKKELARLAAEIEVKKLALLEKESTIEERDSTIKDKDSKIQKNEKNKKIATQNAERARDAKIRLIEALRNEVASLKQAKSGLETRRVNLRNEVKSQHKSFKTRIAELEGQLTDQMVESNAWRIKAEHLEPAINAADRRKQTANEKIKQAEKDIRDGAAKRAEDEALKKKQDKLTQQTVEGLTKQRDDALADKIKMEKQLDEAQAALQQAQTRVMNMKVINTVKIEKATGQKKLPDNVKKHIKITWSPSEEANNLTAVHAEYRAEIADLKEQIKALESDVTLHQEKFNAFAGQLQWERAFILQKVCNDENIPEKTRDLIRGTMQHMADTFHQRLIDENLIEEDEEADSVAIESYSPSEAEESDVDDLDTAGLSALPGSPTEKSRSASI